MKQAAFLNANSSSSLEGYCWYSFIYLNVNTLRLNPNSLISKAKYCNVENEDWEQLDKEPALR